MKTQVHGTTAQFPGYPWKGAVSRLQEGVHEDFGLLSLEHIQLCPQSPSIADEQTLTELKETYPQTRFRLHANVRSIHGLHKWDASTYSQATHSYFAHLGMMSTLLDAPAYSLHAGRSQYATHQKMLDNVKRIQELFSCPVLVEGMYPSHHESWLLSSWEDYRWLLDSGLYFAIDLSHINILVRQYNRFDKGLLSALLLSDHCLEIHLSHNMGNQDAHRPLQKNTLSKSCWYNVWKDCLHKGVHAIHFSEGRIHTLPPQQIDKIERKSTRI